MPKVACLCFVHSGDQPFYVEHSPWFFCLKEAIIYPSRTIVDVLQYQITPSGCTSHRWHLNLSVTIIAIHRYNSTLNLCCKTNFQGLFLCPGLNPNKWGKKRQMKSLEFRKTIMSSHLYTELNLSQRRRPIDVSWMGKATVTASFEVWTLEQPHNSSKSICLSTEGMNLLRLHHCSFSLMCCH